MHTALFYILVVGIGALLEYGLYQSTLLVYTASLALLCAIALSFVILKKENQTVFLDRTSFVLAIMGFQGWLLWLDFVYFKYALPIIGVYLLLYVRNIITQDARGAMPKVRLGVFFLGTFFWAAIGYGVVGILGWQLWRGTLLFAVPFFIIARSIAQSTHALQKTSNTSLLLIMYISLQAFVVFLWLPFSEMTAALLVTLIALFVFDMTKYYEDPVLIRRKIIIKKVIAYLALCGLVLASTPWY